MVEFIMAHQVIIAAVFVAVLDLVFALVPNWQSNGILHGIYVFFQGLVKPKV